MTHTGPNGLVTEYQYDAFGTKIHELLPDGTERRWLRYRADDPYHPANAVYYVRVDGSQQTPELVFFNVLGAEVRRETRSFNSLPIYRDQIYNNLGQLWKRSRLYHPGNTVYWESFNYDCWVGCSHIQKRTAP